jgi:hypothetical protein
MALVRSVSSSNRWRLGTDSYFLSDDGNGIGEIINISFVAIYHLLPTSNLLSILAKTAYLRACNMLANACCKSLASPKVIDQVVSTNAATVQ